MKDANEIITQVLRKQKPSRIPIAEYFWEDTLKVWIEQGYPVDSDGKPLSPDDVFDLDMVNVGGWFDAMPVPGVKDTVQETDEWIITRNGAGAQLKYWKNRSGVPEHIAFEMTTRSCWEEKYRPHLLKVDKSRLDIENARKQITKRKQEGKWTFYGHLFIWENMRQSLGDLCLYESMLLDPDWIHDYCRVYTDFFKNHYRVLFEEAGIPDGIWVYEDLGYKNGTFCSPEIYKQLLFPYYTEFVNFFHSYKLPVILHSCGNIESILDLIAEAGFDGLNPMEVKAGCDVVRFAENWANDLVFVGGLDVRILESGDRTAIKKEVERIIKGVLDAGGSLVFASDHSISSQVKYSDYCYMLELVRNWIL